MSRLLMPLLGCLLVSQIAATAAAQIRSGPGEGAVPQPLKAFAVTGPQAGSETDLTADTKGSPTILVFLRADRWDRPVARFVKTLDQELAKRSGKEQLVAVWLTDDLEKGKEYLPKAQQSMRLEKATLAVFTGNQGVPEGWDIHPEAHATAVVVVADKVAGSFGYRSVNDTDAPDVLKKLP